MRHPVSTSRGPTRRQLLAGALAAGAAALAPRRARAIGPAAKFRIAQLIVPGGNWDPRPTGLAKLLSEIDLRTSIDVARASEGQVTQVKAEAEKLHQTPLLYLGGDRAFSPLPAREIEALRRFVTFGGFLFIDSAEGRVGGAFDGSVRRLVEDLFPRPATGLEPLPADHVIYRSFYLVNEPSGRIAEARKMEAVFHDKRAAVVYGQNDLAGAWERGDFGKPEYECYPGGEAQRENAFRLGINLAMYALCLDYKTDQVHVPFILKRRQWKAPEP